MTNGKLIEEIDALLKAYNEVNECTISQIELDIRVIEVQLDNDITVVDGITLTFK